jgi:pimeloyl-ACP methyl ester carboxylesterase
VIHNYRWRLGLAPGEARLRRAGGEAGGRAVITVPTITMEGDANGAPHPEPAAYRAKFTGKYEHRLITGGVGHNLPQEAPLAFAKAVIDGGAPRQSDAASHRKLLAAAVNPVPRYTARCG